MYLLSAFSPNMLVGGATVTFADISEETAKQFAKQGFTSAVGHEDTANLFSKILGVHVPCVRTTVTIPQRHYGMPPWTALVGQYSGPRLEAGATELPKGAVIRWMTVYIP